MSQHTLACTMTRRFHTCLVDRFNDAVAMAECHAFSRAHPAVRLAGELFDEMSPTNRKALWPVYRRLQCKVTTIGRCYCGQHTGEANS
jgi:hypothetical protein